ncbi:hypothetical protein DIU31_024645 [Mucilaginibacter rubeus]|uniref:Uncharacterized protein n=1 Tax=Mucilaginibacter rubeus TaxID=2027860 RepID=A0AAE6JJG6_9SPHI|nr:MULTISPECIES: hypothetical protein [Mucilaginibacter]QEM06548.1 hypothetical protein DIU31_024645 [Mucilaginibacter rubeus]QEM19137.1 hypothetical protein DIU38_024910 [Mucilaginibacter gossypii]QTE44321.1 hypothetical protein J3L19_02810 [Mucilaginibacter rubeus]QTE50921.1 hypothetical protein J3L21_02785 [Mucilaginibacter rubeus]QTE56004.1 hypothetical protein J3L23_28020 [Mucilaginibacter rubeus]
MEKIGYLEIRITGTKGNLELKPDTLDIRELMSVLEQSENLLFPNEKKDRPIISYQLEEGSVKHIFKTSIQAIIGFNAVIAQIDTTKNIDFLNLNTAKAIESFQDTALKKNFKFNISTSLEETTDLIIDRSTRFIRSEALWADAEFYFYGKITDAGGKDKANIHLLTEDYGTLTVDTSKDILEQLEGNILYKSFGIRAIGKQHSETGEIDKKSLKFVEMVDYSPKYDQDYLKSLRTKAKGWLSQINADDWLNDIRGGYDT